jgi:hypothetical protein
MQAGKPQDKRDLFPIMAGIVAIDAKWAEGLASSTFSSHLSKLKDSRALNCGLALSDRAFDTFDGQLKISEEKGSLASFLFRLLKQLQTLGTVPAVDWNRYAAILGGQP